MIFDEPETRAEVCEECEHLVRAMPLTCSLVKRQKQIGPLPCPHALRAMLYDVEAVCPHPDGTWAIRWRMAEVLPMPAESAATSPIEEASIGDTPTSTQAAGSRCAVKTAQREINPEAIERRARERQSRRRGVSHKAFYVQAHPARPVAGS